MIDSIEIGMPCLLPSQEKLKFLGWREEYTGINRKPKWVYRERKQSGSPYLSFFTAPDFQSYLMVNVSLPAFYCGSNARLLTEVEVAEALNKLSVYVTEKSCVLFNAQKAVVWRVDFARDYFVREESIRYMISRISTMIIPRFETGGYNETTVYFHSKGKAKAGKKPRTICVYGKYEDAINKCFSAEDIEKTYGKLRLEYRYRDTRTIKRLAEKLGLPNRMVETLLKEEICARILNPIEKHIMSLRDESSDKDRILQLIECCGPRQSRGLITFHIYLNTFGKDFYKFKKLGFSKSNYHACLKKCREAGILRLFGDSKPPIKLEDFPL